MKRDGLAARAWRWLTRRRPPIGGPAAAEHWLATEASEYQRHALRVVQFFGIEHFGLDERRAYVYALGASFAAARGDEELRERGRAILDAAWSHFRDPATAARFTRWLERLL